MKALIVLLIGLILLGGAGFGGWTLYNDFIVKKNAEKVEEAPPPPPAPAYVRMRSIVVPVFDANRVRQFVSVVPTLQVDAEKQPVVQGLLPRVENAMLFALFKLASEGQLINGSLVNLPAIKSELTDAAKAVLKDAGLQDVLIQAVMQRNV